MSSMRKGTERTGVRRPGRPRSFDEAEALQALTAVFWDRGFSAASMDDLAAAAALHRPSLYAAFGDKRAMYLAALDGFAGRLEAALFETLAGRERLDRELAAFYRASIDLYLSGDRGPRGCLALCTASTEALREPKVRALLQRVLRSIDRALQRRLRLGRERGELQPAADVRARAALAASTLHSLAIRARAGESRASLERIARAAVGVVARRDGP